MFDGKIAVNFENDEAQACIHLYAPLGPIPAQGREALYKSLLEANLFGAQTLGASLALDEQHQELVLCRCVPTQDATGQSFAAVLERFVCAVEEWTLRLGTADFQDPVDRNTRPVQLPPSLSLLRV